jgi:tRNA A-37 threonylcarbamoyl transferase component Bud32
VLLILGTIIAKLYGYGNIDGLLHVIVLEHVGEPLRTLSQYIERSADIEHAIKQIHKLKIRHGDLHPPNVLID